jgi:quercetin dioxygenase-like cupin family protein
MKLFQGDDHPSRPADAEHFTGAVRMAAVDGLSQQPPVNMYRVTFEPSARTAWHTHSGVQLLIILEGRCRVQKAGEQVHDVRAGSAIRIEPGERHWHGATPDAPMTHLALNIASTTEWMDRVTDAEYGGHSV